MAEELRTPTNPTAPTRITVSEAQHSTESGTFLVGWWGAGGRTRKTSQTLVASCSCRAFVARFVAKCASLLWLVRSLSPAAEMVSRLAREAHEFSPFGLFVVVLVVVRLVQCLLPLMDGTKFEYSGVPAKYRC